MTIKIYFSIPQATKIIIIIIIICCSPNSRTQFQKIAYVSKTVKLGIGKYLQASLKMCYETQKCKNIQDVQFENIKFFKLISENFI